MVLINGRNIIAAKAMNDMIVKIDVFLIDHSAFAIVCLLAPDNLRSSISDSEELVIEQNIWLNSVDKPKMR